MWHVFICRIYSRAGRVRQKIWTPLYNNNNNNNNNNNKELITR